MVYLIFIHLVFLPVWDYNFSALLHWG
uniref:Uncharacterized protein n=1 Tax=Anguilla anguilla TaxID=7936 RepID=A0A0E9U010_ANGAN